RIVVRDGHHVDILGREQLPAGEAPAPGAAGTEVAIKDTAGGDLELGGLQVGELLPAHGAGVPAPQAIGELAVNVASVIDVQLRSLHVGDVPPAEDGVPAPYAGGTVFKVAGHDRGDGTIFEVFQDWPVRIPGQQSAAHDVSSDV